MGIQINKSVLFEGGGRFSKVTTNYMPISLNKKCVTMNSYNVYEL